jgi:hypothetical protein
MVSKLEIVKQYYKNPPTKKVTKTEDDSYYKFCGVVFRFLSSDISIDRLYSYLVSHMLDFSNYGTRKLLLENIQKKHSIVEPYQGSGGVEDVEKYIHLYFHEKILKVFLQKMERNILVLFQIGKQHILLYHASRNSWELVEPEDRRDIDRSKVLEKDNNNLNDIVGFISTKSNKSFVASSEDIVFKTKNMKHNRSTGADCEGAGKQQQLAVLGSIVGEDKKNEISKMKGDICCVIEYLLRHYTHIRKDDKVWFLGPDDAKLYNIENVSTKI